MSYRYDANGNDLNWESVLCLGNHVEELELAIFNGTVELDKEGFMKDDFYEQVMDSNPTMIYYNNEIDIQQMLKDGKLLDDYVEWCIIHNTNNNSVTLIGDVPNDYFTENYLNERYLEVEAV